MASVRRNETIELTFEAEVQVSNPMREIELNVTFRESGGASVTLPGFWDGGTTWKARFAWPEESRWQWTTSCSPEHAGLHGRTGTFSISGTDEATKLSVQGPVRIADDNRHFAHASGAPFNWLGDTWWMGLSRRLPLDGLEFLIEDRLAKGFTVIQIIAGLYPDMDWHDERGLGDGGFPWDRDFTSINPEYFRAMDRRIGMLINAGLSPCIVGFWGYFMDFAGADVLRHHWRNLVARYASLPVTWCVAGEGLMPFYVGADQIEDLDAWRRERSAAWSAMATWIRSQDGLRRPITIHPTDFRPPTGGRSVHHQLRNAPDRTPGIPGPLEHHQHARGFAGRTTRNAHHHQRGVLRGHPGVERSRHPAVPVLVKRPLRQCRVHLWCERPVAGQQR